MFLYTRLHIEGVDYSHENNFYIVIDLIILMSVQYL